MGNEELVKSLEKLVVKGIAAEGEYTEPTHVSHHREGNQIDILLLNQRPDHLDVRQEPVQGVQFEFDGQVECPLGFVGFEPFGILI